MTFILSRLTDKVLIFSKESVSDNAGGFIESWKEKLLIFSSYVYCNNTHIFTIRYRHEIDIGMNILYLNNFYTIIRIEIDKKKKILKLLTMAVT